MMTKIKIDEESCIGCGLCEELVPSHFVLGHDGKARTKKEHFTKEDVNVSEVAIENCPVQAIKKD